MRGMACYHRGILPWAGSLRSLLKTRPIRPIPGIRRGLLTQSYARGPSEVQLSSLRITLNIQWEKLTSHLYIATFARIDRRRSFRQHCQGIRGQDGVGYILFALHGRMGWADPIVLPGSSPSTRVTESPTPNWMPEAMRLLAAWSPRVFERETELQSCWGIPWSTLLYVLMATHCPDYMADG